MLEEEKLIGVCILFEKRFCVREARKRRRSLKMMEMLSIQYIKVMLSLSKTTLHRVVWICKVWAHVKANVYFISSLYNIIHASNRNLLLLFA